jgi:hypothetical protein
MNIAVEIESGVERHLLQLNSFVLAAWRLFC